ncbi:hypothetical protein [Providencia rettgeri]|uniref:hypothetical protein n=1 Tax=Providencia rettgeri TaxID=587 RepID=UPI0039F5AA9F
MENQQRIYDNIGVIKPITYTSERPTYLEPTELEYDTESWFIKSSDWHYEEEQRLLLPIECALEKKNLLFYEIEPKMIKSIILGCQMDKNTKREIFNKCVALNIPVKESFIHSHQFKLDFFEYDEKNHSNFKNMFNLNKISNY